MKAKPWLYLALCAGLLGLDTLPALAAPAAREIQVVQSYVVKPGDTLWGIAGRFLKNPWEWPQIWHKNPKIHNPNLIYPGDRILLERNAQGQLQFSVVTLHPQMGVAPLPTIATGEIMPFLGNPGVISSKQAYDALPYLAAARQERSMFSVGDRLFVSGLEEDAAVGTRYTIISLGPELRRPGVQQPLGYVLSDIGEAVLRRNGPTGEVEITVAKREISLGDRLMILPKGNIPHYFPSAPQRPVSAGIIAAMTSAPELMTGQVVVLDQGRSAGLEPGNVLEVTAPLPHTRNAVTGKALVLPAEGIGTVMVFRVFDHASYAVITTAQRGIVVGDKLRNPPSATAKGQAGGPGDG
ncbi:LysM peptidoglycan-binding domain-containing protein [Acidithiobacillus sp.]